MSADPADKKMNFVGTKMIFTDKPVIITPNIEHNPVTAIP
jgi:hypothetical protein